MKNPSDINALKQVLETFCNYDYNTDTSDIIVEHVNVHGFNDKGRLDNITNKEYIKGVLIPQTKSFETNEGSGVWIRCEYKLVVVNPYRINDGDIVHTPKGRMIAINILDFSSQGTMSATLIRQSASDKFIDRN